MKKWKRRLAAFLMSVMLVSLLPVTALAEEAVDDGEPVIGEETEVVEETEAVEEAPDVELSEIGVWVGDDYIRAEEGPALMSLLPLTEKYYTLNLRGYLPDELKAVSLETIKSAVPKYGTTGSIEGDIAVWARWGHQTEDGDWVYENDDFTILGDAETIDLSTAYRWDDTLTLELIVGTADQFDPGNTRYIISVLVRGVADLLTFNAADENRREIDVYGVYISKNSRTGKYVCQIGVNEKQWQFGQQMYLSMDMTEEWKDSGLTAEVYKGYYQTAEEIVAANAEEITEAVWGTDPTAAGKGCLDDYSYKRNYEEMPEFTVVFYRNGTLADVLPFIAYTYADGLSLSWSALYSVNSENSSRTRYYGTSYTDSSVDVTFRLRPGYAANVTSYLGLELYNPAAGYDSSYGIQYVDTAVVGNYSTKEEIPADAVNIKAQLFSDPSTAGYGADYSQGVTFTIVDTEGRVHSFSVKTIETVEEETLPPAPTPLSADTYFRVTGAAKQADGTDSYGAYVMPYEHDSYYYNGYQTIFLLDGENPVSEETAIYPKFYAGSKVTVHAGHTEVGEKVSTEKQESGQTAVTFQNGVPIQYSAAAENTTSLKNYWVTFLTQQEAPTLFVNGVTNADAAHKDEDGTPIREVILDDAHDYHHDIFIANLGKTAMDDLTVTLSDDAKNIQLDEYWTVNGTRSLDGFTTTNRTTQYGELANVAKIRLLPLTDEEGNIVSGEISGTLTITGGGQTVKIKLTGRSGRFVISTDKLKDGVKYVHYSSVIQTSNMYESDAVKFTPVGGTLPAGLTLRSSGEIYGVPTVTGTWHIKVRAAYTDSDGQEYTDEKEYDLTIADNSNANVWNATDAHYGLIQAIINEDYTISLPEGNEPDTKGYNSWEADTQLFWTEGDYDNFVVTEVRLDGKALTRGKDYTDEAGSTKITIQNQTLRSQGNGTHTISVEFREGDRTNGTLKRAAQNYTLSTLGTSNSGGSSGSSSGGSSGGSSSKPSTKPAAPSTPQPVKPTFIDVPESHTFYNDVEWAYDNGLMQGVTERLFVPTDAITQATVVTVLSRMADVDLSKYENDGTYKTIPDGMWYTNAAVWATQAGLLPNDTAFKSEGTITRANMAIMLVKYLTSLGINTSIPEPVAFADAELMSQEANDAFQVLYRYGIFKGIGNLYMDPCGITTRGQFSALIHRMNALIEKNV